MLKKPELLMPAGSPEVLRTAVAFGADAVYLGGTDFGLRAKAKNFTEQELAAGIRFAHERGVRVYITANIFAHNRDLAGAAAYFCRLSGLAPDALIISDPGLFMLAREHAPTLDIHISTQANNTNLETFRFWHALGAKRAVCARELTLEEIRQIRDGIPADMEIECFVHGAMCMAYSGRCLLSTFLAGRDANQGQCAHPCRWRYALVEETRPGQYLPVGEDDLGSYILNSKDLCMIEHIPALADAGIDSFKVEGRMKSALYVAAVARAYRRAIDDCARDPALYEQSKSRYRREVEACTTREFSSGFYFGRPGSEAQVYTESVYHKNYTYLGSVGSADAQGRVRLRQKNRFSVGEQIEIMKPDGRDIPAAVRGIFDADGTPQSAAPHAGQELLVDLDGPAEPFDILRRCER